MLGAFAVVCIHTRPLLDISGGPIEFELLGLAIRAGSNFAVPFFFIVSGFFCCGSLRRGAPKRKVLWKYGSRLGVVFFAWSFIYGLPLLRIETIADRGIIAATYSHARSFLQSPIELLFRGPSVPLWFIVSLGVSLFLMALTFPRLRGKVFVFAIPMYLVAIASRAWLSSTGNPAAFIAAREILVGPLYVGIGFLLQLNDQYARKPHGLTLLASGFLLVLGSYVLLEWEYDPLLFTVGFGVGRVCLGTGSMLFALSYPKFGSGTILPKLGVFSLGVYVSHSLVVAGFRQVTDFNCVLWSATFPFVVYGIALVISFSLSKNSYTRHLVV